MERHSEGLTERGWSGALKDTSKGQLQGRRLSTRDLRHALHEDLCVHMCEQQSQPWALFAPQDTFHMFFDTGSCVGFEFINWAKLAGQEA